MCLGGIRFLRLLQVVAFSIVGFSAVAVFAVRSGCLVLDVLSVCSPGKLRQSRLDGCVDGYVYRWCVDVFAAVSSHLNDGNDVQRDFLGLPRVP